MGLNPTNTPVGVSDEAQPPSFTGDAVKPTNAELRLEAALEEIEELEGKLEQKELWLTHTTEESKRNGETANDAIAEREELRRQLLSEGQAASSLRAEIAELGPRLCEGRRENERTKLEVEGLKHSLDLRNRDAEYWHQAWTEKSEELSDLKLNYLQLNEHNVRQAKKIEKLRNKSNSIRDVEASLDHLSAEAIAQLGYVRIVDAADHIARVMASQKMLLQTESAASWVAGLTKKAKGDTHRWWMWADVDKKALLQGLPMDVRKSIQNRRRMPEQQGKTTKAGIRADWLEVVAIYEQLRFYIEQELGHTGTEDEHNWQASDYTWVELEDQPKS